MQLHRVVGELGQGPLLVGKLMVGQNGDALGLKFGVEVVAYSSAPRFSFRGRGKRLLHPDFYALSWDPLQKAEQLVQAANPKLQHAAGDRAFYRPSTDSIHLPLKEQFPSAGDYYSTLLHELGHWTGHATRLNRDLSDPFGSIGYAREELRAEIASMIIGSELGIGYDPGQHTAHAASWIKILENQPVEIFRAAADGEKIHTYLQSFQQQQSISGEEPQTDKSEIIKEYDRLVDGPAARKWLEKERPSLVAARDQAIVEIRREKLQKETAEKQHKVTKVRR
jgi:hypothetical protein